LKYAWALAALAALSAPAFAQSMNADAFYRRAVKVQSKGMLAMFSGEAKPLMDEARAAANRARANRQAEAAAGRQTRFCPPPAGKAQLSNKDLMNLLGGLPPAERARIDMTEVMTRLLARKFPC
jgi:hypothetical protein